MKHCPTCGNSYTDDALTYCLTDGAVLLTTGAPVAPRNAATMPTLAFPASQANNAGGNNPSWQPNQAPPQWPNAPAAPPRRSSPLPWILGGVALLLIAGIAVGVALYLGRAKSEPETPPANTANTSRVTPTPTPSSQSSPAPDSSPVAGGTTAPTDTDVVLNQLTDLENEWNDANMKGDSVAIKRILADEFRGVGGNGSVENKEQYLASLAPNPTIKSLTLSDLKVSTTGGTAVLTGLNTAKFKKGGTWVFRFTDTFIWRDGRWQAISSQATRVK